MKRVSQESGFTLVEMAIVMVIIGLLIGGILKGQELIKNASVSATAAQIKAFESAYITFLDVYGAKPGDLGSATQKIPGCSAAVSCTNGDRDGHIYHANSIASNNARALTGQQGEMRQALKHMALAELIGGVDGADNGTEEGVITSKMGGYLYLGESYGNGTYHRGSGTTPSGIYLGQAFRDDYWAGYGRVNTPAEVARLDNKIDDGTPGTGVLLAAGEAVCVNGRVYNEQLVEKRCSFLAKVR